MGDDVMDEAAADAVAAFTTAVDGLAGVSVTSLPGLALIELVSRVETQLRRVAAFDHAVVAALVSSGAAGDVGARTTAALLVQALRVSPAEAAARVRAARELGPRVAVTGAPLDPEHPLVAAAQAGGAISTGHAQVITATVRDLPLPVRTEHGHTLEEFLVGQATGHAPDVLARIARHATAVLDPDGTLATDEDHQRRRGLVFSMRPDGSSDLRGHLTPEATTVARAVLDPLAAPTPAKTSTGTGDTGTGTATGDTAGVAGDSTGTETAAEDAAVQAEPDPRTYAQRMHDALQEACLRLLRSATLPDAGGVPATVLITMTLDQLETRLGAATTSHGGTLTIPAALRLAADADLIPAVLSDSGGVLAYGRTARHATPAQRRALAARDGGCSFPACDQPPEWCQTHHVTRWEHGGTTDLDNLTLVCGFHHRQHERQGWQCRITDGVAEWLPPWWIDQDRTPRRNTTIHTARFLTPPEPRPNRTDQAA